MNLKRSMMIISLVFIICIGMVFSNNAYATNSFDIVAKEVTQETFSKEQQECENNSSIEIPVNYVRSFIIIDEDTKEEVTVGGMGDSYYEFIEIDRSIDYTAGNYSFVIDTTKNLGESFNFDGIGLFTYEEMQKAESEDAEDKYIYKSKITTNKFKRAQNESVYYIINQTDSTTNIVYKFFLNIKFIGELSETESKVWQIYCNKDYVFQDHSYVYGVLGETTQLVNYNYNEDTYSELPSDLTYNSDDESIVSVDKYGKMVFNGVGDTIITISKNGENVQELMVMSLTLENWLTATSPELTTEEEVNKAIEKVEDNSVIAIKQTEVKAVESEVFEKIAETKESYLSVSNDKAQWVFKSDDITYSNIALNPKVTVATEKPEVINTDVAGDAMYVDFEHSGNLPGKAQVYINIGTEKFGKGEKDLNFYYFNETTKKYEKAGIAKYNNGMINVEMLHCSKYAITETTISEDDMKVEENENQNGNVNQNNNNPKDESPDTGTISIINGVLVLTVVSGLGIILLKKREI